MKISKNRILEIIHEEYRSILLEGEGVMSKAAAPLAIKEFSRAAGEDVSVALEEVKEDPNNWDDKWWERLGPEGAHLTYVFKIDTTKYDEKGNRDMQGNVVPLKITSVTPTGKKSENKKLSDIVEKAFRVVHKAAVDDERYEATFANVTKELSDSYREALRWAANDGYTEWDVYLDVDPGELYGAETEESFE